MTEPELLTIAYEGQDRQVYWQGVSMKDGDAFNSFMSNEVAARLYDEEGRSEFETYLQGLANTGFARDSLEEILSAEISEKPSWAVGEAMAEAYLSREYKITWPWNTERDKRHPNASLPGADLVGFIVEGEATRLVLGEVKSSTDMKTPPSVMSGRSGLMHQIDNLASDLSLVCQLLKWLLHRCKETVYETSFKAAVRLFLESGNRALALFGVLIRDTQPNKLDLQARGQTMAGKLEYPTTCDLSAIYLPCAIRDLPSRIPGGEP